MRYLLILFICLQGCSLFRTETNSSKDIESVTKTVELREEVHGEAKVVLKTTTYQTSTSKEVARAEQNTSSPLAATVVGAVGGLTGMGGLIDTAVVALGAAASLKGKQMVVERWSANRNAPAPDDPRLQPRQEIPRKDDELEIENAS